MLTREDLLTMTSVTLVATRSDLLRLDIASDLFGGDAATIVPREDKRNGPADITVARDGRGFAEGFARASHYRRSADDTVVTLRGADDAFWGAFDERSWMLGTPTTIVEI